MSNRTYVCLECRTAKRAEAAYGMTTGFKCPQCRLALHELPWRWRIPKKSDSAGWKALRRIVSDTDRIGASHRLKAGTAFLAALDAQITLIAQRRKSAARDGRLRLLRWKRKEIERGYGLR